MTDEAPQPAHGLPRWAKILAASGFFAVCGALAVWNLWYGLSEGWIYVAGWHGRAQSPVAYWFGIGKWSMVLLVSLGFVAIGCGKLLRRE